MACRNLDRNADNSRRTTIDLDEHEALYKPRGGRAGAAKKGPSRIPLRHFPQARRLSQVRREETRSFFCCGLTAEGRNTPSKMTKVESSQDSIACLAAGVFSSMRSALKGGSSFITVPVSLRPALCSSRGQKPKRHCHANIYRRAAL